MMTNEEFAALLGRFNAICEALLADFADEISETLIKENDIAIGLKIKVKAIGSGAYEIRKGISFVRAQVNASDKEIFDPKQNKLF